MNHKMMFAAAAVLAIATAGCKPAMTGTEVNGANTAAPADAGAAQDAVKAVEAGMADAFHAKDAAKLTSYYASDAVLAVPDRTVSGTDAIAKANDDDLKDPAFKLDFTNAKTDVAGSGDLAYTTGSFDVTYTDSKTKKVTSEKGSYVTVFKKQSDGSWKAVADIATPKAS
jgi:uncharacterized protein (TIGR02246 family)